MIEADKKPVFAELSEDGKNIEVYFKPSPQLLDVMHDLHARFVNAERAEKEGAEGPHWHLPTDFFTAKDVIDRLGRDQVELGKALYEWAEGHRDREEELKTLLAMEGEIKFKRLHKVLPDLANALHVGPLGASMSPAEFKAALKEPPSYQVADVLFHAKGLNPLNGNHMGTGKTLEAIGGVFEQGIENGPKLVIGKKGSLEAVWEHELTRWQKQTVIRAAGEGMPRQARLNALREAELAYLMGDPFWLLINPEMVRMRKRDTKAGIAKENLYVEHSFLYDIEWNVIIVDEAHKGALRKVTSVTWKGIDELAVIDDGKNRKVPMSGTPAGGKIANMFGILHWSNPTDFPSRAKFIHQWFEVESEIIKTRKTKDRRLAEIKLDTVGDVKEEKLEEFNRMMILYMVRRTKEDVAPWLPPKQYVELECGMTEEQRKQYEKFAKMAEIELGDQTLTATNILAIYTRLKQFASAVQKFEDGNLVATSDSGKINMLMEKLGELGILDEDGTEQALIFSQFETMVDVIYDELVKRKIPVVKFVGATKDRKQKIEEFQKENEGFRVLVGTTDTGGLSYTMDRANSVFIMDEKWNPDDQEQAEDRAHRTSRIHQVTVYYLRTKGTIEEYIRKVTGFKQEVNVRILNKRGGLKLYKGHVPKKLPKKVRPKKVAKEEVVAPVGRKVKHLTVVK